MKSVNGDEVSLAKLRLALGPGSYEVDRDVNQKKITTHFSFSKEKRMGIMDHVLVRGENGCSPGFVSCNSEREPGFPTKLNSKRAITSGSSVCSSPGLRLYDPETVTGGTLGTRAMSEAPFKSKHASGFVLRVRSESELQRQNVEKFSKELAKSYKQLDASVQKLDHQLSSPSIRVACFQRFDKEPQATESYRRGPGSYDQKGAIHPRPKVTATADQQYQNRHAHLVAKPRSNFGCVQHRDLVKFMVAAGHISADHNPTPHETVSTKSKTTPDYLPVKQQRQLKTPLGTSSKPETSNLSREEIWKVLKNGPSIDTPSTKKNGSKGTSGNAGRHRAASPVAKEPGTSPPDEETSAAPPES